MFLRHFRRFERCFYQFLESVTTRGNPGYNIQRGSVRRQGEVLRDNEHHPSNLRMSSLKQNCLYISLMFPKLFVQLYNN